VKTSTVEIGPLAIACHASAGTGPAIVLVHGNSSAARSFQHQLDGPLGDKYRVVAIDLPGHGQSANAVDPAATYTLPGYAAVVAGIAQQLGLEQAVFVGWSLGGHIILEATAQLPRAAGWLIYGTPPIGFPPAMGEAFLPHPAMVATFKGDLTEAEMAAYVAAFFKPGTTEIPESFMADVRRTDPQARACHGARFGPNGYKDEIQIVANLTVPLAVVQGEQEQLVNAAYLRGLSMPTLWRKSLQIIPNAGHAPHWEQPDKFNALLAAFVQDCNG
jgi:pimeloyl-ACP methyl ester carboxylesterase